MSDLDDFNRRMTAGSSSWMQGPPTHAAESAAQSLLDAPSRSTSVGGSSIDFSVRISAIIILIGIALFVVGTYLADHFREAKAMDRAADRAFRRLRSHPRQWRPCHGLHQGVGIGEWLAQFGFCHPCGLRRVVAFAMAMDNEWRTCAERFHPLGGGGPSFRGFGVVTSLGAHNHP